MISIIITSYREPTTLPRAIRAFLRQNIEIDYEILIVAPDKESEKIVQQFNQQYPQIKYLADQGKGKPAALNMALQVARGDILVLTDGDVYITPGALRYLLIPFHNPKIGAVSGHPIPVDSRHNLFGYWAHLLTEQGAHQIRQIYQRQGKPIDCSGYFYAIRSIIKQIPEDVLSDDAVISQMIQQQGYQIVYAPKATVYVRYPNNFSDWLLQKTRSAGGYEQLKKYFAKGSQMRSFKKELFWGLFRIWTYPKNLKEFFWTVLLCLARVYLWLNIFWKLKIKRYSLSQLWKRVESTK